MLPAIVLLDEHDWLLRPSIQQSDGRCVAEVEEFAPKSTIGRLRSSPATASISNCSLQRRVDRTARAGGLRQDCNRVRLLRLHQLPPHRRKRIEQNWALEAGLTDLRAAKLSASLVAHTHLPERTIPATSNVERDHRHRDARGSGSMRPHRRTPVVGGAADFIASGLASGLARRGDCLLKFAARSTSSPSPRMRGRTRDCSSTIISYRVSTCPTAACRPADRAQLVCREFRRRRGRGSPRGRLSPHQYLDHLAGASRPAPTAWPLCRIFWVKRPRSTTRGARHDLRAQLSHGVAHLWRALLESYAYAIRHHLEVFAETGAETVQFRASDGGSNSMIWMQIVADVIQKPLQLSAQHPGSCLGAAWTAASAPASSTIGGNHNLTGTAGASSQIRQRPGLLRRLRRVPRVLSSHAGFRSRSKSVRIAAVAWTSTGR